MAAIWLVLQFSKDLISNSEIKKKINLYTGEEKITIHKNNETIIFLSLIWQLYDIVVRFPKNFMCNSEIKNLKRSDFDQK